LEVNRNVPGFSLISKYDIISKLAPNVLNVHWRKHLKKNINLHPPRIVDSIPWQG